MIWNNKKLFYKSINQENTVKFIIKIKLTKNSYKQGFVEKSQMNYLSKYDFIKEK